MEQKVGVFLEKVSKNFGSATNAKKIKENNAVVALAERFLKVSEGTLLRGSGKGKDTDVSYYFRGMLKYVMELKEINQKVRDELWGINGSDKEGFFLHPTEVLHPKDRSGRPVPVLGDGRGRTLTAMGYDDMRKLAENVRNKENLSLLVIAVWKANKDRLKRVVFDAPDDDDLSGLVGRTIEF